MSPTGYQSEIVHSLIFSNLNFDKRNLPTKNYNSLQHDMPKYEQIRQHGVDSYQKLKVWAVKNVSLPCNEI